MTAQLWTRYELSRLIAARHGQPEGVGVGAMIELRMRISPEALEAMMTSEIVRRDGTHVRLRAVAIDDAGYAEPILETVEALR